MNSKALLQPMSGTAHGGAPLNPVGVLLVNLGTPAAPTAPAVRRYLGEFLSDPRVIELPRALWWPILHGVILRLRPAQSAAKYAEIWTPKGSPLAHATAALAAATRERLGQGYMVRHAMRYGEPAVADELDALAAAGARQIVVVPLYPQYSGTSTASVFDAVFAWAGSRRDMPGLCIIKDFHDNSDYIDALASSVRAHWAAHGRRLLVMSFHGVPQNAVDRGDPYQRQCLSTGAALAKALALSPDEYRITFQSRFGRARWIEPATEPTLCSLAAAGTTAVDVICPGFVADCLETLHEIDVECRAAFMEAGGKDFHYVPCLNTGSDWIETVTKLVRQHAADSHAPQAYPFPQATSTSP